MSLGPPYTKSINLNAPLISLGPPFTALLDNNPPALGAPFTASIDLLLNNYAILTIPFELSFPKGSRFKTLDSTMDVGRSVRRLKAFRKKRKYTLKFNILNKCELDIVVALFDEPFNIVTPDDGNVVVIFRDDTLSINQFSNVMFNLSFEVEEFF